MFKKIMHHNNRISRETSRQRKNRLPRIWKVAGKTIDFG